MGQNLKAKNYTYFRTERVTYPTYGPNSTKPSKKAQNTKELLSVSLLVARPEPPAPRPLQCASGPRLSAVGPPPVPKPAFDSSAPSSRPPHLGNGNSGSGRAQAPRRPSASASAPA